MKEIERMWKGEWKSRRSTANLFDWEQCKIDIYCGGKKVSLRSRMKTLKVSLSGRICKWSRTN